MFGRLRAWFEPQPECKHDYRYATLELWNNATLTWYWCKICGEAKPQERKKHE